MLSFIILTAAAGCGTTHWNDLRVGRSTATDIQKLFETTVQAEDRYAYAIAEDTFTKKTVLMMVNLDVDGIVTAKYYWNSEPAPILPFWHADTWQIAMETQVAPSELQEYSATVGPREEAIIQYFGRILFDTHHHFRDTNEVFGVSASMKQILVMAANEYNARSDKQTLLTEEGFVFDGGIHGNKCTMILETIDERQGLYSLRLKGYRSRSFFTGD